jgi:hypothetical protein
MCSEVDFLAGNRLATGFQPPRAHERLFVPDDRIHLLRRTIYSCCTAPFRRRIDGE